MGLGSFFRSLAPGDDHELSRTQYAGRESASDGAASKTFGRPSRNTTEAARRGQAWEDQDRARHTTTSWFRGRS